MNTLTINITPKQQKVLIVLLLLLYGLFLFAAGMEEGYNNGFYDAVDVCNAITGAC